MEGKLREGEGRKWGKKGGKGLLLLGFLLLEFLSFLLLRGSGSSSSEKYSILAFFLCTRPSESLADESEELDEERDEEDMLVDK